jgi:Cu/Ag efflux protein CusF
MKLSILGICVLLAGATAFAAPAQKAATAKSASSTAPASAKAKMMWASGSIEKYDAASKMLTLKHDGKETTFLVGDQTHVMKGKETLSASALMTGQHAKVEYTVAGANKEAHVIELTEAKAPAKK